MNPAYRKKPTRGRNVRYSNNDSKNNYRAPDNYSNDKRKYLSDSSLYNIARFFMGNEVQVLTKNEKIEGVLRVFDSFSVWLSKVIVYDTTANENFSFVKDLMEGKEILWRDIDMIKVLYSNGKTDSVLVDQEISQRKQIVRPLQTEDKSLVPYFDEDEVQLDEDKGENDLDISMKGDQSCWYDPEDMMKLNEEKFNLKSTFNQNMLEYTTQIDQSDPLLREKYERAEKLAREMENDASTRRIRQFEDEDEEQDEEKRFSAVLSSETSSAMKPETPSAVATTTPIKLNPNAPEFRPRIKATEVSEPYEELQMTNMSLIQDSIQQQLQQQQQQQQMMQRIAQHFSAQQGLHQQQQQQQQQQMQQYPGHRLVSAGPQWTVPMHATSPGQYMLQPYLQQGQMMPQVFQARHMAPQDPNVGTVVAGPGAVSGQSAGVFYSLGSIQGQTFFMQPDHMASSVQQQQQQQQQSSGLMTVDPGQHMFVQGLDGHHGGPMQPLRQPHVMPGQMSSVIPPGSHLSLQPAPQSVLQGVPPSQQSIATQQQQQQSIQVPQQQQQPQQQQHINNYYTQSPHPLMAQAINPVGHNNNITQFIFNQQQQLQAAPTIQSYISNGSRS